MRLTLAAVIAIPLGLDLYLPAPVDNPITAANIELGRSLFNDRRLSRDGRISCRSCHDPARAFSRPEAVARGVFGRRGTRNAPALINRGWGRSFFWDGRAATLEEQVLKPIEDPNEMDQPIDDAAARVGLQPQQISRALATYLRSVMSGDSPFDRYISGDRTAISPEARAGLRLFRGKANCSVCHVGPNLTDERFHNTGIAWSSADGSATDGAFRDPGRGAITGNPGDLGAFKTPTLREVSRSAPYMHDGSFATLNAIVDYYDRGGNRNPSLDQELRPLGLSSREKAELLAFLRTLSGRVTFGGS